MTLRSATPCNSGSFKCHPTERFLATGQSFSALHFDFLLGRSTIAVIVRHTCDMIWQHLKDQMMPQPNREDWLKISKGFKDSVDFPNCIGALDGKHFRVKKPPNSGSRYFNFHKFFSVVILALVDTEYRFIYADIGAYGSASDARIFRSSRLAQRLQENSLLIPPPVALPGTSGPYFNNRLTKARRYVECAFGILANKWRIYHTTIQLQPNSVSDEGWLVSPAWKAPLTTYLHLSKNVKMQAPHLKSTPGLYVLI
ncbi:uncharacterized protein ACNLHF_009168 [Anomaloglossus baeobatrachus]